MRSMGIRWLQRRNLGELVAGVSLLALAAGYLSLAAQYRAGTMANPGPGAFPAVVGATLVLVCATLTIRPLVGQPTTGTDEEPASIHRVLLAVAALALYPLLLPGLGVIASTAITVGIFMRASGVTRPLELGLVSLGMAIACWLIFGYLLQVSLPGGSLWDIFDAR